METNNKMKMVVLAMVLTVLSAAMQVHGGVEPITIVYPNAFEHVDGNGRTAPDFVYIPFRQQSVFMADQFGDLGGKPHLLTHFAFRPDKSVYGPLTVPIDDLQISISTTQRTRGALSMTFAENVGPDEKIVYDSPIILHTENIGPVLGPKEFDYIIELQDPFLYDPNDGNLLIEYVTYSGFVGSSSTVHDGVGGAHGYNKSYVIAYDATDKTATQVGGGNIVQFTFMDPCPYTLVGDLNDDCRVDLNDMAIMAGNWLVDCIKEPDDPACVTK